MVTCQSHHIKGEMKNTCLKGNIVEAKVLAKSIELGYKVFIPFGEGHKCDLIIQTNSGDLKKIQIKACRETKYNSLTMNLYSNGGGYNKVKYSKSDVDYFATEFKNQFYLIPIEDVETKNTICFKKDSYEFQVI